MITLFLGIRYRSPEAFIRDPPEAGKEGRNSLKSCREYSPPPRDNNTYGIVKSWRDLSFFTADIMGAVTRLPGSIVRIFRGNQTTPKVHSAENVTVLGINI